MKSLLLLVLLLTLLALARANVTNCNSGASGNGPSVLSTDDSEELGFDEEHTLEVDELEVDTEGYELEIQPIILVTSKTLTAVKKTPIGKPEGPTLCVMAGAPKTFNCAINCLADFGKACGSSKTLAIPDSLRNFCVGATCQCSAVKNGATQSGQFSPATINQYWEEARVKCNTDCPTPLIRNLGAQ